MATTRRPTMTDVARRANVSQATVSYIVNNVATQSISQATRTAVEKAIEELGYRRNAQARSLASGTSGVIVCVIPPLPLAEPVLRLLGALTAEFSGRGFTMTVHFERSGDTTFPAMMESLKPEVVFSLFPADLPHGAVDLGGSDLPDPGCHLQVEYLASRGHERLAFAGSPEIELARQSGARARAVAARAGELGLPEVGGGPLASDPFESARQVADWHGQGISAICANNDEVAFATLRAIRDAGLVCPDDLSVIGYDATAVGALSLPALTSIEWDAEGAAPMIADIALGVPSPASITTILKVRVVERDSVSTR